MKATYIVVVFRTRAFSDERVVLIEAALERITNDGDWLRLHYGFYIVTTSFSLSELAAAIRPLFYDEERLLIAKIDTSAADGWLEESTWDWLARQRGPDYQKLLATLLESQNPSPGLPRLPPALGTPPPLGGLGGFLGGMSGGFGEPPEDPNKPKT